MYGMSVPHELHSVYMYNVTAHSEEYGGMEPLAVLDLRLLLNQPPRTLGACYFLLCVYVAARAAE
jgi:hypothetical protein